MSSSFVTEMRLPLLDRFYVLNEGFQRIMRGKYFSTLCSSGEQVKSKGILRCGYIESKDQGRTA